MIIESSLFKGFIAADSDLVKLDFSWGLDFFLGKASTVSMYLSKASILSEGGIKLLLFLTKELSVSSVPSKYSTSLSFLLNSFTSSFNWSGFPIGGVGVNFKPLFKSDISGKLSFLSDKLMIFMASNFSLFIDCWTGDRGSDHGLGSGPGPCPCPDLCPDPDLGLKKAVLHFRFVVAQCSSVRVLIVLVFVVPRFRFRFQSHAENVVVFAVLGVSVVVASGLVLAPFLETLVGSERVQL